MKGVAYQCGRLVEQVLRDRTLHTHKTHATVHTRQVQPQHSSIPKGQWIKWGDTLSNPFSSASELQPYRERMGPAPSRLLRITFPPPLPRDKACPFRNYYK